MPHEVGERVFMFGRKNNIFRFGLKMRRNMCILALFAPLLVTTLATFPDLLSANTTSGVPNGTSLPPSAADENVAPSTVPFPDFSYYTYVEEKEIEWNISDPAGIAEGATWEVQRDGNSIDSGPFTSDGQVVSVTCQKETPGTRAYTLHVDDGFTGLLLLDTVLVTAQDAEWNFDQHDDIWWHKTPQTIVEGPEHDNLAITYAHAIKSLANQSGAIEYGHDTRCRLAAEFSVNPDLDGTPYQFGIRWVEVDVQIQQTSPYTRFFSSDKIVYHHSEWYQYINHNAGNDFRTYMMFLESYRSAVTPSVPCLGGTFAGVDNINGLNQRGDNFSVIFGTSSNIARWRFQYAPATAEVAMDQQKLALIIEFTPDISILPPGEIEFNITYRVGVGSEQSGSDVLFISNEYTDTFTTNVHTDLDYWTSEDFILDMDLSAATPNTLSITSDPQTCAVNVTNLGNFIQHITLSTTDLTIASSAFDFPEWKIFPGPHNLITAHLNISSLGNANNDGASEIATIQAYNYIQNYTTSITATILDDDTIPPVIQIEYTGDSTDAVPGFWNVSAVDRESGIASVNITIDGTQVGSAAGLYAVPNVPGNHEIEVVVANGDLDRGIIDQQSASQSMQSTIVDDDETPPSLHYRGTHWVPFVGVVAYFDIWDASGIDIAEVKWENGIWTPLVWDPAGNCYAAVLRYGLSNPEFAYAYDNDQDTGSSDRTYVQGQVDSSTSNVTGEIAGTCAGSAGFLVAIGFITWKHRRKSLIRANRSQIPSDRLGDGKERGSP